MTEARIHHRGYLPYEGPRHGPSQSMVTLGIHTVQRVLGLKRSNWQKALPAFTLLVAFVPAIVIVGTVALIPGSEDLNLDNSGDYYGVITWALFLFTAFVAPEALCTDRRSGMLGLYLASPLNRDTYLATKFLAVAAVLSIMTIGPPLLMLIAFTLEEVGPNGVDDWLIELGRLLASALALAVFWTSLSMAVSSITPRRTRASVAIIVGLLVTALVAEALSESFEFGDSFVLLNMALLPLETVYRIYGEVSVDNDPISRVSSWEVYAALIGFTFAFGWFTRWRYQRIEIAG